VQGVKLGCDQKLKRKKIVHTSARIKKKVGSLFRGERKKKVWNRSWGEKALETEGGKVGERGGLRKR